MSSNCSARLRSLLDDYQAGYGPRLTALIGELAGMHRTSRRLIQDFCHSVLHMPMSLGAVQKVIDRVSQALLPHYEPIATLAVKPLSAVLMKRLGAISGIVTAAG